MRGKPMAKRPARRIFSAVAGCLLLSALTAEDSQAGSRSASVGEATFLSFKSPDNSEGSCGYIVVGNGDNLQAAPNHSSTTNYGAFKLGVPNLGGREIVTSVTMNLDVIP